MSPTNEGAWTEMRLRRQWAIYPSGESFPWNWVTYPLNESYSLHAHPDLCISIATSASRRVAVLGLAVSSDDFSQSDESIAQELVSLPPGCFERGVIALAGTYAVIREEDGAISVYTDPSGMMNVFFRTPYVASTPTLIPNLERDTNIDEQYELSGTDNWYTGSLSPFRGVRVLMANHCLDLNAGRVQRFWPRNDFARVSHADAVSKIAELFRGTAAAFLRRRNVLCSITGGRDSRVNLASLRGQLDNVEFFTIRGSGVNPKDTQIAAELARRFGLKHRFIDVEPAPPWLFEMYDEMTSGLATGARREIIGACQAIQGSNLLHLNGNLGALAKAYYWDSAQPEEVKLKVLAKEFLNRAPCIMDGLREWQLSVPDIQPSSIYNLMYLEQRGGRWMGIGETASNLFYESGTLFCSRQVFECICGMPLPDQRSGKLLSDLVQAMWPELTNVPLHSGTTTLKRMLPKGLKQKLLKISRLLKPMNS